MLALCRIGDIFKHVYPTLHYHNINYAMEKPFNNKIQHANLVMRHLSNSDTCPKSLIRLPARFHQICQSICSLINYDPHPTEMEYDFCGDKKLVTRSVCLKSCEDKNVAGTETGWTLAAVPTRYHNQKVTNFYSFSIYVFFLCVEFKLIVSGLQSEFSMIIHT